MVYGNLKLIMYLFESKPNFSHEFPQKKKKIFLGALHRTLLVYFSGLNLSTQFQNHFSQAYYAIKIDQNPKLKIKVKVNDITRKEKKKLTNSNIKHIAWQERKSFSESKQT